MVAAKKIDTTIYPDTDHMGEGELEQLIDELFRPLLARYLASRGILAHVGSNTFIYYRQRDSSSRIAPDVYVLPGVPQARISRSWKLWELAGPPSFALEVVSLDVDKDYITAPQIHAEIGTRELVIFDPEARRRKDRRVWQVFRPDRAGRMGLAQHGNGDRIASASLGCFLRVVGAGDNQRLRIGTHARGDKLFPTEAEAERAAKDAERAAKEALEAENAALRKKLAQARRPPRKR